MLELGQYGKDKVTGFEGTITARYQYLTGCDQYVLAPKMDKDGKLGEAYQFDEGRIEILGKGIALKEVQMKVKGGPQRQSLSSK